MPHTDQLIIQEIRSGNRNAFEQFFRVHYQALCGFACSYVKDADQAEEVVQEAFVNFWEKREELAVDRSLKSYFYTSVRNKCLNYLKHLKVRAEYEKQELLDQKVTAPVDEDDDQQLSNKLNQAMETLPERCKEVFTLAKVNGWKYQEIADALGISIKTVENQMTKALKLLRVELKALLAWALILVIERFW